MSLAVLSGVVASAGTDALMRAEILSYSRSRGLFAGVNLKGVVVKPEDDLNQAVYGMRARVLLGQTMTAPPVTDTAAGLASFSQTVARYAAAL